MSTKYRELPWWSFANPLSDKVWVCTTAFPSDYSYIQKRYFDPRRKNAYMMLAFFSAASALSLILFSFPQSIFVIVVSAVLALMGFAALSPRKPDNLVLVSVGDHANPNSLSKAMLKAEAGYAKGETSRQDLQYIREILVKLNVEPIDELEDLS